MKALEHSGAFFIFGTNYLANVFRFIKNPIIYDKPTYMGLCISNSRFYTEKSKESKLILDEEWCGTVTYQTSCGFPIQDSYCTSWGTNCLDQAADAFDEFFCSP